jgi:hypothetical protein
LGLPNSLAGSTVFTALVLSATYALLRALIRVEPMRRPANGSIDEDEMPPSDESGVEYGSTADSEPVEEPGPATITAGTVEVEPAGRPVSLEALMVHGIHIAVGNPVAHVMQAVRRGDSTAAPVIEKDNAGRATRVTREYKIDQQAIQFVFERDAPDDHLLLTDIQILND